MPKPPHNNSEPVVHTEPVVAQGEEGGADLFPTTPKDISHVTFYFDPTPNEGEDSAFYFVKVETTGAVDDDLDHWWADALEKIAELNPAMADYRFLGAALKYGRNEVYYANDGSDNEADDPPTGIFVHGKDFKVYSGGATYDYSDLFS